MSSPGYGNPLATLSERVDYLRGRWLRSAQLDGGAQYTLAAAGSRRLHGRTSLIYQVVRMGGSLQIRVGVWSARADADEAQAVGAWRTAVYLLGDAPGYRHLAAAWKGLFTGLESGPLPVTVLTCRPAVGLARGWAMPDIDGPHGPGGRSSIHSPRRRC
jgi:hypothetical protein